jgi:hypothetical protein
MPKRYTGGCACGAIRANLGGQASGALRANLGHGGAT